ncbi:MAG: hypothetical protein RSB59_01355 [Clostridia bacterium]
MIVNAFRWEMAYGGAKCVDFLMSFADIVFFQTPNCVGKLEFFVFNAMRQL